MEVWMGFMKQFSESVIAYLHDRVRDLYDFVSQTMHTQIYPNTFTKSTPLHLQIVNNTIMEKNKCGKKDVYCIHHLLIQIHG